MPRKTIEVRKIVEETNRRLRMDHIPQEGKKEMCCLLEFILHDTNNYNGFNWTYWTSIGYSEWVDAGQPGFPEKEKFIYGPKGKEGAEWDRQYYCIPSVQIDDYSCPYSLESLSGQ